MAGIPSIGGIGPSASADFATERTMKVAKMVKDAVDMQGDMAVKLIESATVGQKLNIQI